MPTTIKAKCSGVYRYIDYFESLNSITRSQSFLSAIFPSAYEQNASISIPIISTIQTNEELPDHLRGIF